MSTRRATHTRSWVSRWSRKRCSARQASGPAEQPAVHADRQHPRRLGAFGVEHVEGVAQVGEEVVRRVETRRGREAHVVGVERVRHDEVRHRAAVLRGDGGPERQVVAVVVGVVEEAAVLDDEASRVRAVAARVPADRRRSREPLDDLDAVPQVRGFGRRIDVLVVDPAPAVTGDLVPEGDEGGGRVRIALQRHRDAEHGERQGPALEFAQQAPDARARAVFVDRLHAHVARRVGRGAGDLGQELLGTRIAVQDAALRRPPRS